MGLGWGARLESGILHCQTSPKCIPGVYAPIYLTVYVSILDEDWLRLLAEESLGLYTILLLPILYVEWQSRGGAGGNHILLNIDCKIQRRGVATKEVLNAKKDID